MWSDQKMLIGPGTAHLIFLVWGAACGIASNPAFACALAALGALGAIAASAAHGVSFPAFLAFE
jgi:hypothetical protein